ncbi:LLM class flavin-dependent oxidoreductase [Herbiconiux solani]|uniref:LLM class flavin-dependent oxidoreductase n=1 Tax=Herbiconiux solani TaxID=661329 RepID=UPI0008247618|nr:LLM class flavin-dependent oxidoreductase [Herbiconiux solani]
MEFWLHGFPLVGRTKDWAARAEQQGYAGILLADSETLVADPYVELALASSATEHVRLGVAVTNPITRHPAVTAAAIATVHAESGGRAVLGFGRGDSALRLLDLKPASLAAFKQAVIDVRHYLGSPPDEGDIASVATPLSWMTDEFGHVPVDVAATGPGVIAIGAVHADRLTFNLGADAGRLSWAIATARKARSDAGLDPDAMSFGAYVNVACAPLDDAIAMVRGSASIFAQFLVEGMRAGVPVSDDDKTVLEAVASAHDEAQHGLGIAPQAELLPEGFLRRFALCGPAEILLPRIAELEDLGLDRIVVVPASRDVSAAAVDASISDFATGVIGKGML